MKTNLHFSDLDEQTQKDLSDWLNLCVIDAFDKRLLAALYGAGRFKAWDCPRCGTRVYLGEPGDWQHFQGVDQADYTSYPPVTQAAEAWCDHCRCYHQDEIRKCEDISAQVFGY
jgi:hypothetical protein